LFNLLLILINIAGFFFFIIGLFVTLPITLLALAFVYRQIILEKEKPITVFEKPTSPLPAQTDLSFQSNLKKNQE
jgi:4-hydroxybenzoate polyprenyltransferase